MSVAHKFKDKARTDDVLISESVDFSGLLLSSHVLQGLTASGFTRPSPIQLKAIPLGRCGLDLIVQAKSGTGKTCVFTVVALENIELQSVCVQVLVLAPTREIAIQIHSVINSIGSAMKGLKCHTFIGGLPLPTDISLAKSCHVAVGTPGRIKQLIDIGALKTSSIRLLVLDEADKLLGGEFQEDINWIYSKLPDNKQILALSATYPECMAQHLTSYMRNPTFVRLNVTDPALLGIKQYHIVIPNHPIPNNVFSSKTEVVVKILSSVSFQQCLIFSNFQTRAQNLQSELESRNWPTTCIAGCLDQKQRNFAMEQLKTYKCRILISTDLTSRGIDADKVNLVINLDVPPDHETYLHRIGRAGRFGSFGAAITIVTKGSQDAELWAVERKVGTYIHKLPDPIPNDLVTRALPTDVVSVQQIINEPKSDQGTSEDNVSSHSQETFSFSTSEVVLEDGENSRLFCQNDASTKTKTVLADNEQVDFSNNDQSHFANINVLTVKTPIEEAHVNCVSKESGLLQLFESAVALEDSYRVADNSSKRVFLMHSTCKDELFKDKNTSLLCSSDHSYTNNSYEILAETCATETQCNNITPIKSNMINGISYPKASPAESLNPTCEMNIASSQGASGNTGNFTQIKLPKESQLNLIAKNSSKENVMDIFYSQSKESDLLLMNENVVVNEIGLRNDINSPTSDNISMTNMQCTLQSFNEVAPYCDCISKKIFTEAVFNSHLLNKQSSSECSLMANCVTNTANPCGNENRNLTVEALSNCQSNNKITSCPAIGESALTLSSNDMGNTQEDKLTNATKPLNCVGVDNCNDDKSFIDLPHSKQDQKIQGNSLFSPLKTHKRRHIKSFALTDFLQQLREDESLLNCTNIGSALKEKDEIITDGKLEVSKNLNTSCLTDGDIAECKDSGVTTLNGVNNFTVNRNETQAASDTNCALGQIDLGGGGDFNSVPHSLEQLQSICDGANNADSATENFQKDYLGGGDRLLFKESNTTHSSFNSIQKMSTKCLTNIEEKILKCRPGIEVSSGEIDQSGVLSSVHEKATLLETATIDLPSSTKEDLNNFRNTKSVTSYLSSLLLHPQKHNQDFKCVDLETDHINFCKEIHKNKLVSCTSELMTNDIAENFKDGKDLEELYEFEAQKLALLKSKFKLKLLEAEKIRYDIEVENNLKRDALKTHEAAKYVHSTYETNVCDKPPLINNDSLEHKKQGFKKKNKKGKGKFKKSDNLNWRSKEQAEQNFDIRDNNEGYYSFRKDAHKSPWSKGKKNSNSFQKMNEELNHGDNYVNSSQLSHENISENGVAQSSYNHDLNQREKIANNCHEIVNKFENSHEKKEPNIHAKFDDVAVNCGKVNLAEKRSNRKYKHHQENECKILDDMHAQMLKKRKEKKMQEIALAKHDKLTVSYDCEMNKIKELKTDQTTVSNNSELRKKDNNNFNDNLTEKGKNSKLKENMQIINNTTCQPLKDELSSASEKSPIDCADKQQICPPFNDNLCLAADKQQICHPFKDNLSSASEKSPIDCADKQLLSIPSKNDSLSVETNSNQCTKKENSYSVGQIANHHSESPNSNQDFKTEQVYANPLVQNSTKNTTITKEQCTEKEAGKYKIVQSDYLFIEPACRKKPTKPSKSKARLAGIEISSGSTSSTSDLSLSSHSDISDINYSDLENRDIILSTQCYANKYAHESCQDLPDDKHTTENNTTKSSHINSRSVKQYKYNQRLQDFKEPGYLQQYKAHSYKHTVSNILTPVSRRPENCIEDSTFPLSDNQPETMHTNIKQSPMHILHTSKMHSQAQKQEKEISGHSEIHAQNIKRYNLAIIPDDYSRHNHKITNQAYKSNSQICQQFRKHTQESSLDIQHRKQICESISDISPRHVKQTGKSSSSKDRKKIGKYSSGKDRKQMGKSSSDISYKLKQQTHVFSSDIDHEWIDGSSNESENESTSESENESMRFHTHHEPSNYMPHPYLSWLNYQHNISQPLFNYDYSTQPSYNVWPSAPQSFYIPHVSFPFSTFFNNQHKFRQPLPYYQIQLLYATWNYINHMTKAMTFLSKKHNIGENV